MDVSESNLNDASILYQQDRLTRFRQPGNVCSNIDHELLHPICTNYYFTRVSHVNLTCVDTRIR